MAKYTDAWATVMVQGFRHKQVFYLDLFAGKGEHGRKEPATPLRVFRRIANNPHLLHAIKLVFNDVKRSNIVHLKGLLQAQPGYDELQIPPSFLNVRVDNELAARIQSAGLHPAFCFIDPYGFKGLSSSLVRAVVSKWGCDCLVFFYTSGINRNLMNPDSRQDLESLFGKRAFDRLSEKVRSGAVSREKQILSAFQETCFDCGARYYLPLQFNFPATARVSHHLIFLSKSPLAFSIIKDVMSKYSQLEDGVPNYVYVDGCEDAGDQLNLTGAGPMWVLMQHLSEEFSGKKLLVKTVLDRYHRSHGTCTTKNVRDALKQLEVEGRLKVVAGRRKKGTMGDKLHVVFK